MAEKKKEILDNENINNESFMTIFFWTTSKIQSIYFFELSVIWLFIIILKLLLIYFLNYQSKIKYQFLLQKSKFHLIFYNSRSSFKFSFSLSNFSIISSLSTIFLLRSLIIFYWNPWFCVIFSFLKVLFIIIP